MFSDSDCNWGLGRVGGEGVRRTGKRWLRQTMAPTNDGSGRRCLVRTLSKCKATYFEQPQPCILRVPSPAPLELKLDGVSEQTPQKVRQVRPSSVVA